MTNLIQNIINFIFSVNIALANELPRFDIINPLGVGGDLDTILGAVTTFLLTIGGSVAVIMYLWAGFLFLTAGGQEAGIKKAKDTIKWTTLGLAVLILSQVLIFIVQSILAPVAP